MLAEAQDVQFITGISGWTAAALLAGVLFWLGKVHLPSKDALIEGIILRHEDKLLRLNEEHRRWYDVQRQEYRDSLKMVVDHCQRESAVLVDKLAAELARLHNRDEESA